MRITIDLPDSLLRELKARAALEGVKLKDYLAKIALAATRCPVVVGALPQRSPAPVFHRADAKPMTAMSNAQLWAILDAQSAAVLSGQTGCSSRTGWTEASRKIAESGDDKLVWPEFGNAGDKALKW